MSRSDVRGRADSDRRLYTTIVRFDPVYHGHFKCNLGTSEWRDGLDVTVT